MKKSKFITLGLLLCVIGCNMAPLRVTTFIESNDQPGSKKKIEMECLFRKGSYCGNILLGKSQSTADDKNDTRSIDEIEKSVSELFEGRIKVKYIISIPDTGFEEVVDLGVFDTNKYGFMYDGYFFFHQFNLNIVNPSSPRCRAYIKVEIEELSPNENASKYGVSISEWPCK